MVDVDVSATGRVLGVDLVQRSGSHFVDDQALKTARAGSYRPALVDGIPVAGRYEFRSRTRVRTRTRAGTRLPD
ncbi:MAG: TonB family protein [Gemmatimonadaceae bacterium]